MSDPFIDLRPAWISVAWAAAVAWSSAGGPWGDGKATHLTTSTPYTTHQGGNLSSTASHAATTTSTPPRPWNRAPLRGKSLAGARRSWQHISAHTQRQTSTSSWPNSDLHQAKPSVTQGSALSLHGEKHSDTADGGAPPPHTSTNTTSSAIAQRLFAAKPLTWRGQTTPSWAAPMQSHRLRHRGVLGPTQGQVLKIFLGSSLEVVEYLVRHKGRC